jgi:NitT/TauT family transport system substrate-binding protein
MNIRVRIAAVLSYLALLSILISFPAGCAHTAQPVAAKKPFRVGILPMMTVLPLQVAYDEGLFNSLGLNVEIVPFRSQIERDTALVAGQCDAIVEDIYSAPVFNQSQDLIKIVAVSPVKSYMFAIVVSRTSQVASPADLKNVEIALSLGNIIEYVTDQLSQQEGLPPGELKKTSVPSMLLRLELLNEGKIEAGTFSRPLSDMAVASGARIVADDSRGSLLASSILVSSAAVTGRPDDVKQLLKGFSQASEKISANPAKYRSLLVKIAGISDNLAATIEVPAFGSLRLPTPEEYHSKLAWNLEKQNLGRTIAYQDIVAPGFLP